MVGDIEHWVCPGCGLADGPISENVCDVCAEQFEERREVERLVPASQLRGAVKENERLRAVIRDMKSLMPIVRQHAEQVTEWADASLDPPGGR